MMEEVAVLAKIPVTIPFTDISFNKNAHDRLSKKSVVGILLDFKAL